MTVRLALTAVAHSGRYDPTHDLASLGPIGKDHREGNPIGHSEGDSANLTIVLACIDALQSRAREDAGGKGEIESALGQIAVAFLGIPCEAHLVNILLYIHSRKTLWLHNAKSSAAKDSHRSAAKRPHQQ